MQCISDVPDTAQRGNVHDVFNVSQFKKYHFATPKIESIESNAESLGDWDESLTTLQPQELYRVLELSATEPCQPRARGARQSHSFLTNPHTRKTLLRR